MSRIELQEESFPFVLSVLRSATQVAEPSDENVLDVCICEITYPNEVTTEVSCGYLQLGADTLGIPLENTGIALVQGNKIYLFDGDTYRNILPSVFPDLRDDISALVITFDVNKFTPQLVDVFIHQNLLQSLYNNVVINGYSIKINTIEKQRQEDLALGKILLLNIKSNGLPN